MCAIYVINSMYRISTEANY